MLTIYGHDLSSPANKVRFAANLLEIPYVYERVDIRMGEQHKPEYLAVNPVGKVPALVDDGFMLFESNAMMRYLADKQGSALYPKNLRERALIDQWMDFVSLHVNIAFTKVFYNRLIVHLKGIPVDERAIEEGLSMLALFLPIIENQLNKHAFLVGPHMSLADINLLATLDAAEAVNVDLTPYPNLMQWRHNLQKQAFYQSCHPSYVQAMEQAKKSKE